MRLGDKQKTIIEEMESSGYVWLSHLPVNGQMRFRNRVRAGFTGFLKIEGLTFLTKRVADAIVRGSKGKDRPRLSYKEQVEALEADLVALEREVYQLKGAGARKLKLKLEVLQDE